MADIITLPKPDSVEYADVDNYNGLITEHYNVGKENSYDLKVGVSFSNKGTPNEQITGLSFYAKTDNIPGIYRSADFM